MKKILLALALITASSGFAQIENTWTQKAGFGGLKRERAVAFSINGFGYAGTGIDTAEIVHNDFWKYDATLDVWSQVATIPGSVRRNAISFEVNDKGYVGTGLNTVTSGEVGAQKLNDLWEYNPITNTWAAKAPYPGNAGQGIYFATAFSINGKAYVVGGKHGPNNYSNKFYQYDPVQDQWYLGPDFPGGVRYQLSSLSVNGKGFVGLGTDQDLYNKDWWEYKPSTNSWIQRTDLPGSPRGSATTFTIGGRGFVCMGTNGGMLDDLWEYNPGADTWQVRASYGGSARKGAVAMVIGNQAYVGTGKGISGKKMSIQEYNPIFVAGMAELNAQISTYPNPATDVININSTVEIGEVQLMNIFGQVVKTQNNMEPINVSDLPAGTYILRGEIDGKQIGTQQIIIQ